MCYKISNKGIIDMRQLTLIDNDIKERLTKKKLYYYRQLAAPISPNDQAYKEG